MDRVFYFSGYRMTVFDWQDNHLISSQDFQPDDDGFAEFEYLLENSVSMPSRLLVDMIEEDFRRETIPHVNIFDRPALVQRLLDRHYRDEPYSHAKVIGRTDVGRRDDRVLISALTNTQLLAPWIEVLDKFNVRLAGIWSLPLLSNKLLKPIVKNNEEHVLIVSRQVRSALRNSYFQNGQLLLSRQAKFDKDMWDRDDFEGVIANLERGTIEIYNFMLNQRVMTPKDQLTVYCILQEEQLADARQLSHDGATVHYEFVSIDDVFAHFNLQNIRDEGADALFSYICTKVNPLQDHYGQPEQKSSYYRYLADRVVSQVTEFGALACLTGAVLLAMNSLENNRQEEDLVRSNQQLQANYEARYGDKADLLVDAPAIKKSVELVRTLSQDAEVAPHQFFGPLGSVIGKPEFATVSLTGIDWQKQTEEEVSRLLVSYKSQIFGDQVQDDYYYEEEYDESGEALMKIKLQGHMTIKGLISNRGRSYSESTEQMQNFIEELAALDQVAEVLLLQSTIDMRETTAFTDQVANDQVEALIAVPDNVFEILIVLKVPEMEMQEDEVVQELAHNA